MLDPSLAETERLSPRGASHRKPSAPPAHTHAGATGGAAPPGAKPCLAGSHRPAREGGNECTVGTRVGATVGREGVSVQ